MDIFSAVDTDISKTVFKSDEGYKMMRNLGRYLRMLLWSFH